jgi:competence protein ComEC
VEITDRGAIALAIAAAAGAWWAWPVRPWMLALTGLILIVVRRPIVLVIATALMASLLSARAWTGMVPPAAGPMEGDATLVNDPVRVGSAVRVEVRLAGRHFEAWSYGSSAVAIERRLAGERLYLRGSVTRGTVPSWLQTRHVVGRLSVARAEPVDGTSLLASAANGLRRVLVRGASVLDGEQRALFTGLVIGDDRGQSLETTDDFRGAGLSHLLAVSGQNVAFVLAAATPISSRLGLRTRMASTVALLVLFATITRFEPSVLRATVMAGLACIATTIGRPVAALRILALAVCGLLLVDPFLVRSVGFGLSVAASAGIVVLREPLAQVLPGPGGLRNALAVILAAQLGVAPLLIAVFGGVPVASLPANLVAEPVAGFVMIWGASAGLVAGVVPAPLAELIHLPTSLAIWWVASVARWATDARLGELGPVALALAVGGAVSAAWMRTRSRVLAGVGALFVVIVVVAPAVRIRLPAGRTRELTDVGTLSVSGRDGEVAALSLSSDARPADTLRALRRAGVVHLDVLALPARGSATEAVAAAIVRRIEVDRVVVEPDEPP